MAAATVDDFTALLQGQGMSKVSAGTARWQEACKDGVVVVDKSDPCLSKVCRKGEWSKSGVVCAPQTDCNGKWEQEEGVCCPTCEPLDPGPPVVCIARKFSGAARGCVPGHQCNSLCTQYKFDLKHGKSCKDFLSKVPMWNQCKNQDWTPSSDKCDMDHCNSSLGATSEPRRISLHGVRIDVNTYSVDATTVRCKPEEWIKVQVPVPGDPKISKNTWKCPVPSDFQDKQDCPLDDQRFKPAWGYRCSSMVSNVQGSGPKCTGCLPKGFINGLPAAYGDPAVGGRSGTWWSSMVIQPYDGQ